MLAMPAAQVGRTARYRAHQVPNPRVRMVPTFGVIPEQVGFEYLPDHVRAAGMCAARPTIELGQQILPKSEADLCTHDGVLRHP